MRTGAVEESRIQAFGYVVEARPADWLQCQVHSALFHQLPPLGDPSSGLPFHVAAIRGWCVSKWYRDLSDQACDVPNNSPQ